jgi:Ran GTPase-activating protein (RanGAP) involved in mRNA processing and transport
MQHHLPLNISRFANVTPTIQHPLLLQHKNLVFVDDNEDLESVPKMLRERLTDVDVGHLSITILMELLQKSKRLTSLWFVGLSDDEVQKDDVEGVAAAIAENMSLTTFKLSNSHMDPRNISVLLSEGLMHNNSITMLDIGESGLGSEHGSILASALCVNKTIVDLKISYNLFGNDTCIEIINALQGNPSLRVLEIAGVRMDASAVVVLSRLLDETNPLSKCQLTSLRMYDNGIGEIGARAIAQALVSNKTLQTLELGNSWSDNGENEIGDLAVEHIALALQVNTCLTTIDLTGCAVRAKGGAALAVAISKNKTLKRLNLSENRNLGDGLRAIVGLGGADGCALEALLLSSCKVDSTSLALLASALPRTPSLTELDLHNNDFSTSDMERILGTIVSSNHLKKIDLNMCDINSVDNIAAALTGNNSLTELVLDYNEFGDLGTKKLAMALKSNTTLRTLSLASCDIGAGENGCNIGVCALADMLLVNNALRSLSLYGNSLGELGTRLLAAALPYNRSLRHLSVSEYSCGDEGAFAFARALSDGSSVVELEMVGCGIGNAGAIALAEGAALNRELRRLHLSYNKIGKLGLVALKRALFQNLSLEKINVVYNYEN